MASPQPDEVTERLRNITVADEQGQQDEEEHAGAHDVDTARGDGSATDTAAGRDDSTSLDYEDSSMRIHLASARSLEAEGVLPSPVADAAAMYPPMEPFWMTGPDGMPMAFNPYAGQPMFIPGSPFPLSPVATGDGSAIAAASAAAAAAAAAGGGMWGAYLGAYAPDGSGMHLPFMFAPPSPVQLAPGMPVGDESAAALGMAQMYGLAQGSPTPGGYDPMAMIAPYMGMMDPQMQAQAVAAYVQAFEAMRTMGGQPIAPTLPTMYAAGMMEPPSPGRGARGSHPIAGGDAPQSPRSGGQQAARGGATGSVQGSPASMPMPVPARFQQERTDASPLGSPTQQTSGQVLRRRSSSTVDVLSETPRGPRAGNALIVGSAPASPAAGLESSPEGAEEQPQAGGAARSLRPSSLRAAHIAVISVVRDVSNAEQTSDEELAAESRAVRDALLHGRSLQEGPSALLQLGSSSALTFQPPRIFVVKSYSEDDVHKALKYHCWSSTISGNRRLDTAFREATQTTPPHSAPGRVFLFFSVNSSGQFCGVAEMTSPVDFGAQAQFWQQSQKWSGQFSLRWHCVKDVPNALLRHIMITGTEGSASAGPSAFSAPASPKPVTNSRDAQELPLTAGMDMLRVFLTCDTSTSLLDDMLFYSHREHERERQRHTGNVTGGRRSAFRGEPLRGKSATGRGPSPEGSSAREE